VKIKGEDKENISQIDIENDENGKPMIQIIKEDKEIFKPISNSRYNNFTLNDIKTEIYLSQSVNTIVTAIKSKRELLNSVKEGYKKEIEELNDLLNPLLALEKL
jgi:hypothetical protein